MIIKKEVNNKIILGIDPSINTCGAAIFKNGKFIHCELIQPKKKKGQKINTSQNIIGKNKSDLNYIDKSRLIFFRVCELVKKFKVQLIILEVPEFFGVAGYLSRETGSVFKLTFISGMIASLDNVICVNPSAYRGQMPKHVIQNRMQKNMSDLDIFGIDHNVIDALSLCWWYTYGKI